MNHDSREAKELNMILTMNSLLSQKGVNLDNVVRFLANQLSVIRIHITIIGRDCQTTYGLTESERVRGAEPLSRELIKTITERGEVFNISNVSESPEFRNRIGAPDEEAENYEVDVTIPLRGRAKVVGALSFRKYMREAILEFDHEVKFLRLAAQFIGHSLTLREGYEEEIAQIKMESDALKSRVEDIIRTGADAMVAKLNGEEPDTNNMVCSPTNSEQTMKYQSGSLEKIMNGVERQVIVDALTASRGSLNKAAESLQITERIMGLRVAKYSIELKQFKVQK